MSPSRPLGRGGLNLFTRESLFSWSNASSGHSRGLMDLTQFDLQQWCLAALAAFFVGVARSGFAGVGMLTVILMAAVMPGKEQQSTGIVLPLLLFGDLLAARTYRHNVQWRYILRLLPAALLGVGIGTTLMGVIGNHGFKPFIGALILALCALQLCRQWKPHLFYTAEQASQSRTFSWLTGTTAGITTMMANAAGPVMTLYFLTVQLPKLQFVATAAWYFLIVNALKIPFSAYLGLINLSSLSLNLALTPFVVIGLFSGRHFLKNLPQKAFERALLGLTILAALHLLLF